MLGVQCCKSSELFPNQLCHCCVWCYLQQFNNVNHDNTEKMIKPQKTNLNQKTLL